MCVTSNSWLDFGADPNHDPDPDLGIFQRNFSTEFLPLRDRTSCENFAGSAGR